MRIGVPTEVKNNEFRVAITPAGAMDLIRHGHDVLVQSGAGPGSSISDAVALAHKGWRQALADDAALALGLNVHEGSLTYEAVAEAFDLPYVPVAVVLA